MPELPEVQTIVNDLKAAGVEGTTIKAARVFWSRTIAEPSANAFCKRIRGKSVSVIRRRGKFIVFDFKNGNNLLMHLRMSGRLHLVFNDLPRSKHEHVILSLADGRQLRFHDTRKFGRLYLTSAGLGNIYVDEALWESKIHPCRMAASLTASEIRALHRAIPRVLKRGLKNLGTSLGTAKTNFYSIAKHQGRNRDELKVFRRTDLPCPRCRTKIQRIIVGQRSTHICPKCQVY